MTEQSNAQGAAPRQDPAVTPAEAEAGLRLVGLLPDPTRTAELVERLSRFRADLRRLDRYQTLATEPTVLALPEESP